jgi:hypothetical protein
MKRVTPKNLLFLFVCLLLNKKIILISKNHHENAILFEELLSFLEPLSKYVFTNISFLHKIEMIDYLDTPTPYIIGLPTTLWNQVWMHKWNEVSDDTVAFDIDTELIMTKIDLPVYPEPISSLLTVTL